MSHTFTSTMPSSSSHSPSTYTAEVKKEVQLLTSFNCPKEDQGIIFNHIEGVTLREYLLAISSLVDGPQNITAVCRASGNRVLVFLASAKLANTFQAIHGRFSVQNLIVKTRKLKAPSIRLFLLNVSPTIPNQAVEDFLRSNLQVQLTSPVSILCVGPSGDLFSHVIEDRRQVYIHSSTDVSSLPHEIALNYNGRLHHISLLFRELICSKCNKKGHTSDICEDIVEDFVDTHKDPVTSNNKMDFKTNIGNRDESRISADAPTYIFTSPSAGRTIRQQTSPLETIPWNTSGPTKIVNQATFLPPPPPKKNTAGDKHRLSIATSTVDPTSPKKLWDKTPSSATPLTSKDGSTKPKLKLSIGSNFKSIKSFYDKNQSRYPLSFADFKKFVDQCHGRYNLKSVLESYQCTDRVQDLKCALKETQLKIKSKQIKARMTRIIKNLDKLTDLTKLTDVSPNPCQIFIPINLHPQQSAK